MKFDLLHPADQLVIIMQRIYGYGMTTTSGGNLSIKTPDGDIWVTPGGIDKGTLARDDMMCIKPDGTILGRHKPSIELPFHQTIYKMRPDIAAIVHAHPPSLVAFSNVGRAPRTRIIPNVELICGNVGFAPYAIPGSKALGDNIAAVFEKGCNVVMLENHGVVVGSKDLSNAFIAFETLEFCARLEINACKIGTPNILSDKNIEISHKKQSGICKMEEFTPQFHTPVENSLRRDMCAFIQRSYDQGLFTSSEGTFSARVDENSYIITPFIKDRKYLEIEDLVLIQGEKREAGKNPSRSVELHREIYDQHPEINSIIIAHPPNIMAFSVTECEFDSRTIPESYIMLRTVSKIPFGSSFMQPKMMAAIFSEKNPVALVENDCIIVTGTSLVNAFDRLEVAEYSAKSIIDSNVLGPVHVISDEEVEALNIAFNL